MPLFRDANNILRITNYDCDICHRSDVLRASCYIVEIEGKKKAACGKCYRQAKRLEDGL